MAKKNDKWKWIMGIIIVFLLIQYVGRQGSSDVTRTFSKTTVSPGEQILVTYQIQRLQGGDIWIAEMDLPDSFNWQVYSIVGYNTIEEQPGKVLRFYSEVPSGSASSDFKFYISATEPGVFEMPAWVYHPRDDVTYTFSTLTFQGDLPLQTIAVCVSQTSILSDLGSWLNGQITTSDMISKLRTYLIRPC